MSDAPWHGGYI